MIKRISLISILLCILVTLATVSDLSAQAALKVGPEAIWSPGMTTMQTIHQQCDGSTDFSACFVLFLQKSGATPQAIQFVKMTDSMG